jgi:thymidylate kinase
LSKKKYKLFAIEGVDGAGKSTLVDAVVSKLTPRIKILACTLASDMVEIFEDIVDVPTGRPGEYKYVIPSELRHSTYVVAGVTQFRLRQEFYDQFDALIFDRWWITNQVYLAPISQWDTWYQQILNYLPTPDHIFYLDICPSVAATRLKKRGDWMCDRYSQDDLVSYLKTIQEKYIEVLDGREETTTLCGTDQTEMNADFIANKIFSNWME